MVHANDMVNVTPFLLSIFWVQGGEGILGNKDKKSRELSEKHVARPKCTNTKHVSFECVKFKPKLMFCFVLQNATRVMESTVRKVTQGRKIAFGM